MHLLQHNLGLTCWVEELLCILHTSVVTLVTTSRVSVPVLLPALTEKKKKLILQLKLVSVFAHQRLFIKGNRQWKATRDVHMTSIYFSLSVTVTF